jgi:hypothetical protein
VERLSEREKERIAELWAAQAPAWVIHKEISRSRWAIRRYINRLQRASEAGTDALVQDSPSPANRCPTSGASWPFTVSDAGSAIRLRSFIASLLARLSD